MEMKDTAPAQGGIQTEHAQSIKINTARQYRVIQALYGSQHSRENIDRISGASNGPEVVRQLRELGWDVPCKLVPHTDRDGLPGKHGVYSLSVGDRQRLRDWLTRRKSASRGMTA